MLALLEKLKSVVQDFHAREDKLDLDYRVRINNEKRTFNTATKEHAQQQTERLANAEIEAQDELARWSSRFDRRKVRINEAHKKLRRKAVDDVTEHEGRRKHRLQQNALEAEKRRDTDLANASTALKEFKEKLAVSQQEFANLEAEASRTFRSYRKFRQLLSPNLQWPEPDFTPDEYQLFDQLGQLQTRVREGLTRFRGMFLANTVRLIPPAWLLTLLLLALGGWVLAAPSAAPSLNSIRIPALAIAALIVIRVVAFLIAQQQAAPTAKSVASDLAKARRLHDACYHKADLRLQQDQERIKSDFQNRTVAVDQEYKNVIKEAIGLRDLRPRQIDEKAARVHQKAEKVRVTHMERLERQCAQGLPHLKGELEAQTKRFSETQAANIAKIESEQQVLWNALEAEWKQAVQPLCETLEKVNAQATGIFSQWDLSRWKGWTPPEQFQNAAKFGRLEVDVEKFAETSNADIPVGSPNPRAPAKARRLALPCPATLSVPLALTFPNEGSILFEAGKTTGEDAISAINNIIYRLLSTTPPGKISFTIFDPVGLGQNFAGIMHLADYEASHINSRIWTQTQQIEEKLAELNDHMEKVIQMYLRNEYATIAEYNAQAGSIAEKYHFLVIASFPVNFSDTAAQRLRNIAASGARCGVYTLVHWDQRQMLPQNFVPDELRKNSVRLIRTEKGYEIAAGGASILPSAGSTASRLPGTRLLLDPPPAPEFATDFLHRVGEFSKDSNRVEVPFEHIAPPDAEFWKEETTEELRAPIGRSGATKFQYLAIGKGTRQHALIAGKTGSGKSTLFHIIITNLALWCSPEQVEFYLVDFKKGVEFKCYASRRLPHARVVAIESDRQFGLSVLERVDAELRRRGDLFRKLGVQDVPGYKRAGGKEQIPRSLLMIDEFQEFFTEEDRVSQSAAVLLDRIVRQGRAFGIHVILGSQTLGGAYTLARATLGQMVIRIALQCNEADAYLIMDQDNPAPRLLSRPGEGIYNDSAGAIEGNSPFQAVWLSEDVRDNYLAKIRSRADHNGAHYPGPFIFEGNAPADVKENLVLNKLLAGFIHLAPLAGPARSGERAGVRGANTSRLWLGAPNSIKGPTEAVFQRQSASNLMVVGQNDETTLAILGVSLVSLAAQHYNGSARVILLDSAPPGSPQAEFLDRVIQSISLPVERPKAGGIPQLMTELSEELKKRSGEEQTFEGPTIYLFIQGLENFKKLRQEEEFSFSSGGDDSGPNPAVVLQTLITEGPSHGIHIIITCDTFNNVSRFLGRKALSEFAMRVLFQMSASDSAALIDAPDAGTLGLNRALLYNDREGYMETFRPYARPGNDWLDDVARQLKAIKQSAPASTS
jgi:S-DNA-T family DNA segregation ATPase FtsK/SpoIIIE